MNRVFQAIAMGLAPRRKYMSPPDEGSWIRLIGEPYVGAWQADDAERPESLLAYAPAFTCITLIAGDISKLGLRLVQDTGNDIWQLASNPAYSPILRKPNAFQNRIQFIESWLLSKLSRGNTYVLKQRDNRGVVSRMTVLNPDRVQPLVSNAGEVFYRLNTDNLAGLTESEVIVPAREIIHDRFNTLYHPLVGLSPIYASAMAASQGLKIQRTSSLFFANGARPSGILTAPGEIDQANVDRLKAYWESNFTGDNAAKLAVLGDGLQYTQLTMNSVDAQLIEQLKWTAETVCSTFHVPTFMAGVGAMPTYNNVEALWQQYYSQCLQIHIESIELCLDEGLELKAPFGTEFDIDALLRMDKATQIKALVEGLKGIYTPDEARGKLGLGPKPGGNQVYLQQQNYSLEALAKRDVKEDPFGQDAPPAPVAETPPETRAATVARLKQLVRERVNA